MPFQVRSLKGTRKDPSGRSATRAGRPLVRSSRVLIGTRSLKPGRGTVLSDGALVTNIVRIREYLEQGVITIKVLPNTSFTAQAVLKGVGVPLKRREPTPPVVEVDPVVDPESSPPASVDPEDEEDDEADPLPHVSADEAPAEPESKKKAPIKRKAPARKRPTPRAKKSDS